MRILSTVDNMVAAVVRVRGNGKGFAVKTEVKGDRIVILHPVPRARAEAEMLKDGEQWFGELGELHEVGTNPKTGARVFIQPFLPLKRIPRNAKQKGTYVSSGSNGRSVGLRWQEHRLAA
jgi:hypothetical protein